MPKPKNLRNVMAKQVVKVQVHNSPPPSIPLILPTSPDMIPAFALQDRISTGVDVTMADKSLKRDRKSAFQTKLPTNKTLPSNREKFKRTDQELKKQLSNNRNLQPRAQNISIPLNARKQNYQKTRKSSTLTNLASETQKPDQKPRAFTSREAADKKDNNDFLKTFLKSDFPPYNPDDFTPKDDSVDQSQEYAVGEDELLKNIRQELDEWLTKCPEKKNSCPEQWSNVPSTYQMEDNPKAELSKRKGRKEHAPSKGNVGIQTSPPRTKDRNLRKMMTPSFLNDPDLMAVKRPKTPSPLPKTRVFEAADQLMSVAEREFLAVEAKLSSDRLLSAKTSSLHTSELSSARRIMTDVPLSPTKGSAYGNSSLRSRSNTSYRVPQNSPSSFKIHGNEENYKRNNGEQKNLDQKLCPHHKEPKLSENQSEQNKSSKVEQRNLSKTSAVTEFSMFYEQQQLVERKMQISKEKNSATVIFKSDAKVISSTDVMKHDAQTNTGPVFSSGQSNNLKFTPNSSIISMKTSKPEEDDQPLTFSGKLLNVQKMPSVNIRPGFTIQHGPKVNIVGSSSSLYKPKRRNTEFFDVVYPPNSPVCSESSFVSEQGRQNRQTENHAEYICERHTFPSGRLIPGSTGENLRRTHLQNSLNLTEKKEMLIELIKSVTEKIEQKSSQRKKNCCRLLCSLPLLASVVRKIQVDCVKCVDLLNSHLDRLVALMKEELRGYKELSDDHCCQLDEAIHYQIVELELMQEENLKGTTGNVTVVKHKESEAIVKPPKKTVSFESITDELAQSAEAESRRNIAVASNQTLSKKNMPSTSGKVSKPSSGPKHPITSKKTTNVRNVGRTTTEHKQMLQNVNRPSSSETNLNPILKKKTNFSGSAKETTVIDQVLKNLSQNKSILKPNTVVTESKSVNKIKKGKCLNAFIKVVDQKESTSEFESWIAERSIKIRQIHDELNKMVEGSMEKYLETHSSRNETVRPISGLKLLTRTDNESQSEENNEKRTDSRQEENQDMDNKNPDSSMQDAVQEYDEDFEEDDEELPYPNGSDRNFQQFGAEAESDDSTPSSHNEEVITDEEIGTEETPVIAEKFSIEFSNSTKAGKKSPKPRDVEVSGIKEAPAIQISSDLSEKSINENKTKPETVSIATSPINFKTSHSIDVSVNTSTSHIETRKETTATSPIIPTERSLPQFKSTMVQTESLGIREIENIISNANNKGEVGLTVPQVRLTPRPIENVLKITLGETNENSLALQTDSSNQTLKLVVQLPALEKTNENKKITELDCSDTSERGVKSGSNRESNTNASTNLKNTNSVHDGRKFYDTLHQDKLNEQTIKDIIEPTVSEVLKKISKDNNLSTDPFSQNEKLNKPLSSPNTSSGLVKPNVILQTKHGLWKKYDKNPILSIIDLEQPNPKVDSSNQTEVEKQNVCVQVARSVAGSDCEKATSARMLDGMSSRSRGYLEMLLPPSPSAHTVPSSLSHSTGRSSSRSSSATSTSSNRKFEGLRHMEKLSDGELLPESCNCRVGEVCEVCVPRLDLSFGELKTKKRSNRTESDSSSDHFNSRHSSVSLSNLPLHLEPRPTSARTIPSSAPNLPTNSVADLRSDEPANNTLQSLGLIKHPETAVRTERKPNMKQFSEIARSVLNDLGKELQTFSGTDNSKYAFSKPPSSLPTMNFPSASNTMDSSSSDSLKSSKSQKSVRTKKSSSKHGTKPRASLVIRTPVETPRIDVVIEDPEMSTSSYETSVTSVSVDQLPEALASHSSADASS